MSADACTTQHVGPSAGTALFPAGEVAQGSPPAPASRERAPWNGREWRVTALVVLIAAVSGADLYMTLTYLHHGGMAEGNPVARWVMSIGSPWLLGAWKVGMVCFTCLVLFAFKKRGSTEVAAWVCCMAMTWLTVQWSGYVRDVAGELQDNPTLTQASSWVSFDQAN